TTFIDAAGSSARVGEDTDRLWHRRTGGRLGLTPSRRAARCAGRRRGALLPPPRAGAQRHDSRRSQESDGEACAAPACKLFHPSAPLGTPALRQTRGLVGGSAWRSP